MNLLKDNVFNAMLARISNFEETAERQWGTLTHAQMLAHCTKVLEISQKDYKRQFLIGKLFGKYFLKSVMRNDDKIKKNIKSSKKLFVTNPQSFKEEKTILIALFQQFYDKGAAFYEGRLHPIFGVLTSAQWGTLAYKHLHHHLRQFES
ncbi:MAG: DUF1569 domain-containing protein [Flavobacteriaceae bacterium]|nr:DUF1569 domain-containing protein [Flavobacteriaceae bacterium]